ncbi:MAG: 2OG-Fe(II) oxygenase [Acidobacteria bacterium]|nr:2OG-Fe(II) oxygenase [Acidobacteriota bacterium]
MNSILLDDSTELLSSKSLDELSSRGWCVQHTHFDHAPTHDLLNASLDAYRANLFEPAGVGAGSQNTIKHQIRSDYSRWWDPTNPTPLQENFLLQMTRIQRQLNRAMFLGIHDLELHSTIYPSGGHYEAHLDQFQGRNNRLISMVYYLNPQWQPEWGGQLRMHLEHTLIDIEPIAGNLVLFLSDSIVHEVLPTLHQRHAITGWFRNRPWPLSYFT